MFGQSIDAFVRRLVKDAGLDTLGPEFVEDYIKQFTPQAERRIGMAALKMLDEDGKRKYMNFVEQSKGSKPTPEEAIAFVRKQPDEAVVFFRKYVPDFDKKIEAAFDDFAKEFVASMKKKE